MPCKLLLLIVAFLIYAPAFAFSSITPIDAERADQAHNNQGVEFMREGDYLAAIKSFKIAIGINPHNQTSAVYHNNLGRSYLALARLTMHPSAPFAYWAQVSFEAAIEIDCMNFRYYQNLSESFAIQGKSRMTERLMHYRADIKRNPFSAIPVALILEKQGERDAARAMLFDFAQKNPDLLISDDVMKYANSIGVSPHLRVPKHLPRPNLGP